MELLKFRAKYARALCISSYLRSEMGERPVVCFSCGNAANELRLLGLDVLEIGEQGKLVPNHWFKQSEIAKYFPNYFDATPGHLSMELMLELGWWFEHQLSFEHITLGDDVYVPTGSGETLVVLKLRFPEKRFHAVYNVAGLEKETEYHEEAPLNQLVKLLATTVTIGGQDETTN